MELKTASEEHWKKESACLEVILAKQKKEENLIRMLLL